MKKTQLKNKIIQSREYWFRDTNGNTYSYTLISIYNKSFKLVKDIFIPLNYGHDYTKQALESLYTIDNLYIDNLVLSTSTKEKATEIKQKNKALLENEYLTQIKAR